MNKEIEENTNLQLDFLKLQKIQNNLKLTNVIPVAVQNLETKEVLLIAYVNQEAFDHSIEKGIATFWSTSRNELWEKGKTSGDYLELIEIRVNCEQNSLLYLVKPKKGVCHTKDKDGNTRKSCFYRKVNLSKKELEFI